MGRAARYVAAWLLVALLSGEAVLRWGVGLGDPPLAMLDPVTEYELVPSARYRRWGNDIAINSHGMRAPEHPATPEPGTGHVLILGDSVVYGGHFLDQSETIAARLSSGLDQGATRAECSLRVLPMAVSSWGPVNQAAALERDGAFGARIAFLVLSAHDLYDVPFDPADILPYRTAPSRTALGDAIQIILERLFPPAIAKDPRTPKQRAALSLGALERMADHLAQRDIPLVLAYHPTTPELSGQVRKEKAVFADWATRRDLEFLDMTEHLRMIDYRDEIHPNAIGAQRIADHLQRVIPSHTAHCGSAL